MNRPKRKNTNCANVRNFLKGVTGPPTLLPSQAAEHAENLHRAGLTLCKSCKRTLTEEEAEDGFCNVCDFQIWGTFGNF